MLDYGIRTAVQKDTKAMGKLIAECFWNEFEQMTPYQDKLASLYEKSIIAERFFVYEKNGEILGIAALTDNTGRCIRVDYTASKELFGEDKGKEIADSICEDSMTPLPYPITVGYIEYVATAPKARGKGIATTLLKTILKDPRYTSFLLDTLVVNTTAQRVYKNLGFVEIGRKPPRDNNPDNERIVMEHKGD
jgi:ribosomal protein S18 acetylase RimI-like enzyme